MKPLVSVIIPVYNVEKYLDKCLDSVVNQTYTNLEIIIVDDGSPDRCPAICDEWMSRDSRIKVIHQPNGGLSRSRNAGLKIATGEFIGFVDSDDWIEPDMYETLLSTMLETGADIVVCNFYCEEVNSDAFIQKPKSPVIERYTAEEALKLLISEKTFIHPVVWNKLFRKHLLTNLLFPEDKIYEDNLWTPQAIGGANSIITINSQLYHYLYRSDSLSNDENNLYRRLKDILEIRKLRILYIHDLFPSLEPLAIAQYQTMCCQKYILVSQMYSQFDTDGSIRRMIYDCFCQWSWNKNLLVGKYKNGIRCLVFRFWPNILPLINIIHIKLINIWHKIKTITKCLLNRQFVYAL